jgi:prophage regulatory protein
MERIIGSIELHELVPADPSTIWRWEQRGLFPKRIKIGPRKIGWRLSAVEQWLADRDEVLPKQADEADALEQGSA